MTIRLICKLDSELQASTDSQELQWPPQMKRTISSLHHMPTIKERSVTVIQVAKMPCRLHLPRLQPLIGKESWGRVARPAAIEATLRGTMTGLTVILWVAHVLSKRRESVAWTNSVAASTSLPIAGAIFSSLKAVVTLTSCTKIATASASK